MCRGVNDDGRWGCGLGGCPWARINTTNADLRRDRIRRYPTKRHQERSPFWLRAVFRSADVRRPLGGSVPQPLCDPAVMRAGALPVLAEAVCPVPTVSRRARWGDAVSRPCWGLNPLAIRVDVAAPGRLQSRRRLAGEVFFECVPRAPASRDAAPPVGTRTKANPCTSR